MAGPIELYLVRHAIAAQRGEEYPDDTKRPLTQRGAARFRQVVQGLRVLGIELDQILTSPLVRTRQTAEILAAGLQSPPPITELTALAPEGSIPDVLTALGKHARQERLALVGHEPGIGELAAHLIGSARPLEFKKGAVCRIDVDRLPPSGPGLLRWFAAPRVLRSIRE
jgi:phosphohistidine phosphatase